MASVKALRLELAWSIWGILGGAAGVEEAGDWRAQKSGRALWRLWLFLGGKWAAMAVSWAAEGYNLNLLFKRIIQCGDSFGWAVTESRWRGLMAPSEVGVMGVGRQLSSHWIYFRGQTSTFSSWIWCRLWEKRGVKDDSQDSGMNIWDKEDDDIRPGVL